MLADERRSFTGSVSEIIATARWLDQIADWKRLSPETVFALQLCAEEILTNVVQHGGDADVKIEVGVAVSADRVELTVDDNGAPFDITKVSPRKVEGDLMSLQPGGLGILLTQKFASALEYGRGPLGNHTAVIFDLAHPPAGSAAGA